MKSFFQISELLGAREAEGKRYLEFLRVSAMSAGVYVLPAGEADPQQPHKQDEMYYVIKGRARMKTGAGDQSVGPGAIIFVAADMEHRFYDIAEELTVLVFFAPAESQ